MIIGSFIFFLLTFAAIGIASAIHKQNTTEDYLVAGRSVNPWLTALSSMATNNSGYAFIGLVGFAYRFGLHSLWLSVAWILGDVLVWCFVHRRVRVLAGKVEASSVPALLGTRKTGGVDRTIVIMAGILTFVFLGVYAAAQLKAGSTALHSLFGWDLRAGAVIGAVIVVVYCYSGGLRASIWTDAAQAVVMMGSMIMILTMSWVLVGGFSGLRENLAAQDPGLAQFWPPDLKLGFPLYFLGFVAGGFGAIGAPHILIRSMAIRSQEEFPRARRIYLSTFVPFVMASALIGLFTRALMPELAQLSEGAQTLSEAAASQLLVQQAEQSLPLVAMELLPKIAVGLTLAAIFAATMSTADSQILSCSAAVTEDIFPTKSYRASKLATLSVTLLSLGVALFAGQGVFALVLVAWSALSASLGPILLVRLAGKPVPTWLGILMMISGPTTVVVWGMSPYAGDVFKLLPGLAVPFLIYAVYAMANRMAGAGDHRLPA